MTTPIPPSLMLPITGFYASILGIVLIYLAALVIRERMSEKVSLGEGDPETQPMLLRSSRAFGNYVEYVPITLLLLAIAELNQVHSIILHICGAVFMAARFLHAYGLRHHVGASWQRFYGMILTFGSIAVLSSANLLRLYGII